MSENLANLLISECMQIADVVGAVWTPSLIHAALTRCEIIIGFGQDTMSGVHGDGYIHSLNCYLIQLFHLLSVNEWRVFE